MNNLDAPTVLLQWSVGMCVFMWVTGRRREVGIGYGWTVRGSALAMAVLAIALGLMADDEPSASTVRDLVAVAFAASLVAALVVSWQRRKVGVAKQRERAQVSSARIIEMTGIDRQAQTFADGPEFPPVLDIAAAAVGVGRGGRARCARHSSSRSGHAVPGRGERCDAPRPLVPRATGPAAGPAA